MPANDVSLACIKLPERQVLAKQRVAVQAQPATLPGSLVSLFPLSNPAATAPRAFHLGFPEPYNAFRIRRNQRLHGLSLCG